MKTDTPENADNVRTSHIVNVRVTDVDGSLIYEGPATTNTPFPEPWKPDPEALKRGIQEILATPPGQIANAPEYGKALSELCQPASYGEPWDTRLDIIEQEGAVNRAVACVNACQGIADPEKAIQAAREWLASFHEYLSSAGHSVMASDLSNVIAQLNGRAGE